MPTLAVLLLIVAVVLFVVAAFGRWAPALAVGLACFAGSFLATGIKL